MAKRGENFFLRACRLRGRNLSVVPSQDSLSRRWKVFYYIGERIFKMNLNSYFLPVFALQVFYFSVILACYVLLKVNLRQNFEIIWCSALLRKSHPCRTQRVQERRLAAPPLFKQLMCRQTQPPEEDEAAVHYRHFTFASLPLMNNIFWFLHLMATFGVFLLCSVLSLLVKRSLIVLPVLYEQYSALVWAVFGWGMARVGHCAPWTN